MSVVSLLLKHDQETNIHLKETRETLLSVLSDSHSSRLPLVSINLTQKKDNREKESKIIHSSYTSLRHCFLYFHFRSSGFNILFFCSDDFWKA